MNNEMRPNRKDVLLAKIVAGWNRYHKSFDPQEMVRLNKLVAELNALEGK